MNYLINLVCLDLVIVFIVDVSGAAAGFRRWVNARRNRPEDAPVPPFDCSLCMTWWAGLAYSLFSGFSLPRLAAVAVLAAVARQMGDMLFIIREGLTLLVNKLSEWIER